MELPKAAKEPTHHEYAELFEKLYEASYEIPTGATEEQLQAYRELFSDSVSILERLLGDPHYSSDAMRYLGVMAMAYRGAGYSSEVTDLDYATGDRARKILFAHKELLLQEALKERRYPRGSTLMQLDRVPGFEEEIGAYLKEQIANTGVDLSEFEDDWQEAAGTHGFDDVRLYNIFQLLRLERKCPGAAKELHRTFGISNFARYPLGVLEAQYAQRGDAHSPYGIMLFPRKDWNGVFYGDADWVKGLHESLGSDYLLRIIECSGKWDIGRKIVGLDRTYGSQHEGKKVSFAVICGHGNKEAIVFGEDTEKGRLTLSEFTNIESTRTREFFVQNPTLVLVSCEVGTEGGIAQEISRAMAATVIAPNHRTKTGGEILYTGHGFSASYRGADTLTYVNGVST